MVQMSKQQLRQKYLHLLKQVDAESKKAWDESIFKTFISQKYLQDYQVFALYFSLAYEVDTINIIQFLLQHNKKVALPRINNKILEFFYINSLDDLVCDHHWKIYQPKSTCPMAQVQELEVIIVPLIAFNDYYDRLGHGQGYYDRYLSNVKLTALKLVLAYQLQRIPSTIHFADEWDVRFDALITN